MSPEPQLIELCDRHQEVIAWAHMRTQRDQMRELCSFIINSAKTDTEITLSPKDLRKLTCVIVLAEQAAKIMQELEEQGLLQSYAKNLIDQIQQMGIPQ